MFMVEICDFCKEPMVKLKEYPQFNGEKMVRTIEYYCYNCSKGKTVNG